MAAHHEDGREQRIHAVRPDPSAVHEAGEEGELRPEERAVLAAEYDLEVTLRSAGGKHSSAAVIIRLYGYPKATLTWQPCP